MLSAGEVEEKGTFLSARLGTVLRCTATKITRQTWFLQLPMATVAMCVILKLFLSTAWLQKGRKVRGYLAWLESTIDFGRKNQNLFYENLAIIPASMVMNFFII